MEPLPAPVRRREERDGHLGPVDTDIAVVLTVELVPLHLGDLVDPVLLELLIWQCRTGHVLAGVRVLPAPVAVPVLHRQLTRKPHVQEPAPYAAVVVQLPVVVGRALPRNDRL